MFGDHSERTIPYTMIYDPMSELRRDKGGSTLTVGIGKGEEVFWRKDRRNVKWRVITEAKEKRRSDLTYLPRAGHAG